MYVTLSPSAINPGEQECTLSPEQDARRRTIRNRWSREERSRRKRAAAFLLQYLSMATLSDSRDGLRCAS